jgi:hypothetical protein
MMQVFAGDVGAGAVPTHHQPQVTSRSMALRIVMRATPNSSASFFPRKRAADLEIGGIQPQTQSVGDGFVDHQ